MRTTPHRQTSTDKSSVRHKNNIRTPAKTPIYTSKLATMINTYYLTGTLMLITGAYLRYQINKRRFYRRNPNGLQQFKSYRSGILITFIEKLIMILTTILITTGICLLAWGYRENHINDTPFG